MGLRGDTSLRTQGTSSRTGTHRDIRKLVTPNLCDATRLLPRHSSGNDVIVRDIDGVRNGPLLSTTLPCIVRWVLIAHS